MSSEIVQYVQRYEYNTTERLSAQCVALRMLKQVVMYGGRNLQWCKQFLRHGGGPKILKVGHVNPSRPLLT